MQIKFKIFSYLQSPQDHLKAPKHLDGCISPSVLADGTMAPNQGNSKMVSVIFKVFICLSALLWSNLAIHFEHAALTPSWSHTQESGEPVNLFALLEGLRVVE